MLNRQTGILRHLSFLLLSTLLLIGARTASAQVECGNPDLSDGCGRLVQVSPDSFVMDFSQCVDEKGRNRGLVVRLDLKPGKGRFKCQQVTHITNGPDVNFEPGFYRILADIEYNRPDDITQTNESFYLEVVGEDTTGPCGEVNVKNRFVVVPDTAGFSAAVGDSIRVVQNTGLFHLSPGQRVFFKHYQILVDPELTPNPTHQDSLLINKNADGIRAFGDIESVHLFRMTFQRVDQDSVFALTKTANRDKVTPGGRIDYALRIQNTSPDETVRTLRLRDVLPPQVTLDSVTPAPVAIIGDTLIWTFPVLGPAETIEIDYSVTVADTFQLQSLPHALNNVSSVTSSCGPDTAAAQVLVIPACDLGLTKVALSDSVVVGKRVSYTLTVVNNGPFAAFDVSLLDILPDSVTFLSSSRPALLSAGGDSVFWSFDSLAPGVPETITYAVQLPAHFPALPFALQNTSILTADCGSAGSSATVTVVPPPPCELGLVSLAGIDSVVVGEDFGVSLVLSNLGPAVAPNPEVSAILPDSVEFVSSIPVATVRGDTLFWTFDSLGVGARDTVSYTLRTSASLSALPKSLETVNIIAAACGVDTTVSSFTVLPPPPCDLVFDSAASADSIVVGEEHTFSLSFANLGPAVAPNPEVSTILPDSVAFVSSFPVATVRGDTLFWTFDSLGVGARDTVSYTLRPSANLSALPKSLEIVNIITAACGADTAIRSIAILPPPPCDLVFDSAVSSDSIVVGEEVTFSLAFINLGPGVPSSFEVISALPDSVEFLGASVSPSISVGGDSLFWNFDSLAVGAGDTISYTVRPLPALALLPDVFEARSIIRSSCGSDSSRASVVVTPPPPCDLTLQSVAGADSVVVGDEVSFTLVFANNGPAVAPAVEILSLLPDSVEFVSASIKPLISIERDKLFWKFPSLAVGARDTITYIVRVNETLTALPLVLETSTFITSSCGADSAIASIVAVPPPPCNLDLALAADVDSVVVGETLRYSIVTRNSGPAVAVGLQISVALSEFLSFGFASSPPTEVAADTLVWTVDSLGVGQADSITFAATLSPAVTPLPAVVEVSATVSSVCGADSAALSIVAIPPPPCRIALTNTASRDSVITGEVVSFTHAIKNDGPATAIDLSFQAVFSEPITFVSGTDGVVVNASGDTLFWSIDSLAVGAAETISYQVRPTGGAGPLPRTLQNQSFIAADCGADTAIAAVVIVPPPPCDLSLANFANTDTVIVGNRIRHAMIVTNQGPATAIPLHIYTVLPDSVDFVEANLQPDIAAGGDTLFWQLDSLASSLSDTISYVVQVREKLYPLPQVLETVSVVFSECGADTTITRVVARAPLPCILTLRSQTEADSVVVGNELNFSLFLDNAGPATAFELGVHTVLPEFSVLSASSPQALLSGDTLFWQFDSLQAGASVGIDFRLRFSENFPSPPQEVRLASYATSDCGADSAVVSLRVVPAPPCDLQVSNAATEDTVFAGGNLRHNFLVENLGPAVAYSLNLFAALPDSVTFIGASTEPTISDNGDTLFWHLDSLAVGEVSSIRYALDIAGSLRPSPLELTTISGVSADCGGDTTLTTVTAIDTTVECALGLTVATESDSVKPGDVVPIEISLTNFGPDAAGDVSITQTVPDGLSLLAAMPAPERSGNTFVWRFATLGAGATETINFQVATEPTYDVLPVRFNGATTVQSDCDTLASGFSIFVARFSYDLRVTKSVSPGRINQDDELTYRLVLDNLGPDAATEVKLTDVLPDSFVVRDFLNLRSDSESERELVWDFQNIGSGQSVEVTFTAGFDPQLELPGQAFVARNTAIVTGRFDSDPSNDTSHALVEFVPDLRNCEELFRFDRNVFEPDKGSPLQISFEIDSGSETSIDLYDITGYRVSNLHLGVFGFGPNVFLWDGTTKDGQRVGSGVYLVDFRTRDRDDRPIECMHKLIIVR